MNEVTRSVAFFSMTERKTREQNLLLFSHSTQTEQRIQLGGPSHYNIRMQILPHYKVKVALLQPLHHLGSPGPCYTYFWPQFLFHRLVALFLLCVWEIDVGVKRFSTLVVVCHRLVVVRHLIQRRYTHRKARRGEELFDGLYEIHAVAGDRRGASSGAEVVLHVDDKQSWFESHDEDLWNVRYL